MWIELVFHICIKPYSLVNGFLSCFTDSVTLSGISTKCEDVPTGLSVALRFRVLEEKQSRQLELE